MRCTSRPVQNDSNSSRLSALPNPELRREDSPDLHLKVPRREEAAPDASLLALREGSVEQNFLSIAEQYPDGELIGMCADASSLAEVADRLLAMRTELLSLAPKSKRPLKVEIFHKAGAQHTKFDLKCLLPLVQGRRQGMHIETLEMEVSVRHGLPDGFADLLRTGRALKHLSLIFIDPDPERAPVLDAHLLQCLRARKYPLNVLELTNFNQAVSSASLGKMLKSRFPLNGLSLVLSDFDMPLDPGFRVADLIQGKLRELQLKGLILYSANLAAVGKRLIGSPALVGLHLQSCVLMGNSQPLFCGLVGNRSLQLLTFLQNRVQDPDIPAHRLLRLLQGHPNLKRLHIDDFTDAAFRAELAQLNEASPKLELALHSTYIGHPTNAVLRSGWHPDLDGNQVRMVGVSDSPSMVKTPIYRDPDSSDDSVQPVISGDD